MGGSPGRVVSFAAQKAKPPPTNLWTLSCSRWLISLVSSKSAVGCCHVAVLGGRSFLPENRQSFEELVLPAQCQRTTHKSFIVQRSTHIPLILQPVQPLFILGCLLRPCMQYLIYLVVYLLKVPMKVGI